MKRNYIPIALSMILCSCHTKQEPAAIDHLKGIWKITRIIAEDDYEISKEEQTSCINKEIVFKEDSIIDHTQCLNAHLCIHPEYKIQRVNTRLFFENDTSFINDIGFHTDSINVITTTCNDANYDYIEFISADTLVLGADNRNYIMAKQQ